MSSTGSGGIFHAGIDPLSQARLAQKTTTTDTGTNLAAMNYYPGMLVAPLDSTAGFTAGTLLQRNPTNTGWVSINPPGPHDHSSSNQGGLFSTIINANIGQALWYNFPSPKVADFYTGLTAGAGATVTNVQGTGNWYINLSTGNVANNLAQADMGGIAFDWASPIRLAAKTQQLNGTTAIQGRLGINVETTNVGATNATKMLGFEFCDLCGTGYALISGDGALRTSSSTAQAYAGTNNIRFIYTPSLNVVGTVNQTVATTKTSNLPNSGQSDQDKSFRIGIVSTNTTGKNYYLYGFGVSGTPKDIWYA